MTTSDSGHLISARYISDVHFRDVEATFAAVRRRDRQVARRFSLTRFVRRSLPGEWPKTWLQSRNRRVIDHLDRGGFVVVTLDSDGLYVKEAAVEVDPVGKLGMTIRPRSRATGRRRT